MALGKRDVSTSALTHVTWIILLDHWIGQSSSAVCIALEGAYGRL